MSRSGYSDDCENIVMWRGQVASAMRGKRGQAFLREMLAAMDAMPSKRLIKGDLVQPDGEVCAIGSVINKRGLSVEGVDAEDPIQVAHLVGIAHQMAAEIEYVNDESGPWKETPEQRFDRVRAWIVSKINPTGEA